MKKSFSQHKLLFILLLFAFVSVASIYLTDLNGHIWAFLGMNDDGRFHVMRIEGLYQSLKRGVYFPSVNMSFMDGFGYIANIFYSDLWLYPAAFLRLLGFTTVQAFVSFYVILNFCTLVISFWSFYQVSRKYDKSLVFSLLYTVSFYRIFDMVRRFDIGEALTLAFLPLVVLGVYEIFYGNRHRWLYLTFGMVAVIYSHALSPVLIVMFICMVIVFRINKLIQEPRRILSLLKATFWAVMLTLAYFLPMVEQLHWTQFKLTHAPLIYVSQSGMTLYDLIHGSVTDDLFNQNIGLLMLVVAILIPVTIWFVKNPALRDFAIIGEILLFMTTKFFPWQYFDYTPLNMIQFPWRFDLLVTILFTIFLASDPLNWFIAWWKKVLLVSLSLGLVVGAEQKLIVDYPQEYSSYQSFNKLDSYSIGSGEEYLPMNADLSVLMSTPHTPTLESGTAVITDFSQQGSKLSFNFQNANNGKIDVPVIGYYGYSAKDSTGQVSKFKMDLNNNGLGQVIVNGTGTVRINYYETAIQKYSRLFSIFSLLILMVAIIFQKRMRNRVSLFEK
ncbi:hypothetical protein [Companilactobacillus muriivasis]|uniref:hypothetical protein n=1 Tax=Companilactobacillus muriivasis TaxID=3081444 RepID=UPI0030C75C14